MEILGFIIMSLFTFVLPLTANTTNLAFNRPAYQSSTHTNFGAELAVDGNADTNLMSKHCAHGDNDSSNWLAVDLGRPYFINYVVLTNRHCIEKEVDCANIASRLDYFRVRVSDVSPLEKPPIKAPEPNCGKYNSRATNGGRMTVHCHANKPSGRYVIIQQPVDGPKYMTICELEVYGFDSDIGTTAVTSTETSSTVHDETTETAYTSSRLGSSTESRVLTIGTPAVTSTETSIVHDETTSATYGSSTLESSTESHVQTTADGHSLFGARVGTAVGTVVLLMLIILTIIIFVFFHPNRRKKDEKTTAVEDSKSFQTQNSFLNPEICKLQQLLGSPKLNGPNAFVAAECGDQQLYANTESVPSKISVVDFPNYVKENSKYFKREFESVPMESNVPCSYGKEKQLKSKNRFQNIIPYDYNRVVLVETGQPYSDYINASYITGVNSEKMVATQGPNEKTIDDFWQMIHQLGARVIVMLCNLEESGKIKCNQYWPHSGTQTYGKVQVELTGEENWPYFNCRYLKASKDSNSLDIIQWQFTSWPDHGVPENVRTMLSYRDKVRQSIQKDAYTVVHCSAGVGRTGCFMAIDYLLEQVRTEQKVDVPGCLRALREKRPQMIQTLAQYEFVYRALVTHITLGNTLISSLEFEDTYIRLQQVNSGKSELERQFDILKQETTKDPDKPGIIYPQLFLHSAKNKCVYIVSEVTESHSGREFWKALDKDCSVLVLLDNDNAFQSMFPESQEPFNFDTQTVELLNKSERAFGTCYNLQMSSRQGTDNVYANTSNDIYANCGGSNARNVTVLHVTSQPNTDAVRSLYSELIEPLNNGISIFVRHSSKSSLPGFIVAACNALEMVDRDGEVDIFLISEELRNVDNNFIPDLKSYQLLHDIVLKHLKKNKRTS